jgi:hypothetical protein
MNRMGGQFRGIDPVENDRTPRGSIEGRKQIQQCGFSGTLLAREGHELPPFNEEVDSVKDLLWRIPEGFDQIPPLDFHDSLRMISMGWSFPAPRAGR